MRLNQRGAGYFLLVMSVFRFPHLMNLPLLSGRLRRSNDCLTAGRSTANAALSDGRLLNLLAGYSDSSSSAAGIRMIDACDSCGSAASVVVVFFFLFTTAG